MIKEKDLIEAARIVQSEYRGKQYNLTGKNHDKRVTLKGRYSRKVNRILFCQLKGKSVYYPWEQIVRLSQVLDVYVTDLVQSFR
jgi:hypothetical protein